MGRPRLTDAQLVVLNAASNYAGGVVPSPRKGTDLEAHTDTCSWLLIRGYLERVAPVGDPKTWLQSNGVGPRSSLVITNKGLVALNVSPEDDMPTKKNAAQTEASAPAIEGANTETAQEAVAAKDEDMTPKKKKGAAAPKKAATKAAAPKKVAKANGTGKGARRSDATRMICDLILANHGLAEAKRLTDSEIFAKVQAKHGLSDNKKVYVGWYRGQMRREGVKNVPEAHRASKD